jgi:hypothetical protein
MIICYSSKLQNELIGLTSLSRKAFLRASGEMRSTTQTLDTPPIPYNQPPNVGGTPGYRLQLTRQNLLKIWKSHCLFPRILCFFSWVGVPRGCADVNISVNITDMTTMFFPWIISTVRQSICNHHQNVIIHTLLYFFSTSWYLRGSPTSLSKCSRPILLASSVYYLEDLATPFPCPSGRHNPFFSYTVSIMRASRFA